MVRSPLGLDCEPLVLTTGQHLGKVQLLRYHIDWQLNESIYGFIVLLWEDVFIMPSTWCFISNHMKSAVEIKFDESCCRSRLIYLFQSEATSSDVFFSAGPGVELWRWSSWSSSRCCDFWLGVFFAEWDEARQKPARRRQRSLSLSSSLLCD